jgi:NarL family two-component system response regulator LiaR
MNGPVTVLIVDDHAVVRQGVRASLEARTGFVVGEAESGDEAVHLAGERLPDVVLMDLLMPGTDGVAATRRIRALSPRTQVVVLTSHHDDVHIFPALRAGAISYLLKTVTMDELAAAVERAAVGEVTLHQHVAARVVQELHRPSGGRDVIGAFATLTGRELQVLELIARGRSNREIVAQLGITEHTVEGHVSNILSKLHLADRTQAAVFAWREGIVRREEP